jgi:hypothetical protein
VRPRENVAAASEQAVEGIGGIVVEPYRAPSGQDVGETSELHGGESPGDGFVAKAFDGDRHEDVTFEAKQGDRIAGYEPSSDGQQPLVALAVYEVGREVQRDVDEWFEHVVSSIPCARE